MEVKIGVQHAAREILVETQASQDEVSDLVEQSVGAGSLLVLVDVKGRKIAVPGDKITYVEIGGGVSGKVGFGH